MSLYNCWCESDFSNSVIMINSMLPLQNFELCLDIVEYRCTWLKDWSVFNNSSTRTNGQYWANHDYHGYYIHSCVSSSFSTINRPISLQKVMPPKRMLTYTRCPPAHFMISTCDTASRPLTAPGDAQAALQPGASGSGDEAGLGIPGRGLGARSHCCRMLQGLQDLRNNGTLCDYSLFADGQVWTKLNDFV